MSLLSGTDQSGSSHLPSANKHTEAWWNAQLSSQFYTSCHGRVGLAHIGNWKPSWASHLSKLANCTDRCT